MDPFGELDVSRSIKELKRAKPFRMLILRAAMITRAYCRAVTIKRVDVRTAS